MSPVYEMLPLRYRAIWISDVHLGTRDCRAEFLLDFLRSSEAEYLYLVGDIVDVWSMKRFWYWPQAHNDVVRTVLDKARRGTKVFYIPGNHDELLRDYAGMAFGAVQIRAQCVHLTAAGQRLLVLHGDEFDGAVQCSRLAAMIGTCAYDLLLWLNRAVNRVRRRLGFPYWSLAAYLKSRMPKAMRFVHSFEQAAVHEAARRQMDGVVCGHIHRAQLRTENGLLYCNDGDWVESCTALAEQHDGALHLIHWADHKHRVKTHAAAAKAALASDAA